MSICPTKYLIHWLLSSSRAIDFFFQKIYKQDVAIDVLNKFLFFFSFFFLLLLFVLIHIQLFFHLYRLQSFKTLGIFFFYSLLSLLFLLLFYFIYFYLTFVFFITFFFLFFFDFIYFFFKSRSYMARWSILRLDRAENYLS